MSVSGREALPNVLEWSGGLPRCLEIVGRPYWMSGSCRESFPHFWQWSGGPTECAGVFGRPSRMSGSPFRISCSGQLAFPDVR